MEQDRTFGVNSRILDLTVGKRFVELMSGKGGLGGLLLWLSQLDFVEDLPKLVQNISYKEMFYDTSLMKCAKEALKRPEFMREEEIATMLGDVCVNPECKRSYSIIGNSPSRCRCGGEIDSKYSLILDELDKLDINPTPEGVMMWVAYEELADAYVLAYKAIRLVLKVLIEQRGWSAAVQFLDFELKDRLDYSFYYGEPGDQRIAAQEREILMFLYRGNICDIGVVEAESLIRKGVAVVKFGHLFNQLFCSGANIHYDVALAEFTLLYNKANERYRRETFVGKKEREKRTVEVLELAVKQYYASLLLDDDCWRSGRLAHHLRFIPLDKGKFPIFTKEDSVALNLYVAPSGCGKTTAMSGAIAHAVDWGGEIVLNVMGDEKNALTLAHIPMFPCHGHTGDMLETLSKMGVPPHGIPVLNLTFLCEGDQHKYLSKDQLPSHPPTIYDRIVEVEDTFSFNFKFETGRRGMLNNKDGEDSRGVWNILGNIAKRMGYGHVCGVINAVNLLRKEKNEYDKESKPDIQVSTELFNKFVTWRPNNKFPPARIFADEMSRLCPVTHAVAGTDTSKSSATVSDSIKMLRGLNTSFDGGTQRFSEINPDAIAEKLNVFFRELPQSQDKQRSQRDIILESLELIQGKAEREMVSSMMERKVFPREDFYWFWWNKHRASIQVVTPNPPFFMINQPLKSNLEVVKAYEKFSKQQILLDSWSDVPHLKY
jgi:hypothetical protein